jgi:hypothetical protein
METNFSKIKNSVVGKLFCAILTSTIAGIVVYFIVHPLETNNGIQAVYDNYNFTSYLRPTLPEIELTSIKPPKITTKKPNNSTTTKKIKKTSTFIPTETQTSATTSETEPTETTETTDEPSETTDEPSETTDEPSETTDEPSETTDEPS